MKRTNAIVLVVVAMVALIATFPHAEDFALAFEVFAAFIAIPLALAIALRGTRFWWFARTAVVVVALLGILIAPQFWQWLAICALYAAFGVALDFRRKPDVEPSLADAVAIEKPANSREPA